MRPFSSTRALPPPTTTSAKPCVPGVVLFSLQFGDGQEQLTEPGNAGLVARDLGLEFNECAAIVMNLHLVVSVDTSNAHLAGALARPVWVALPFAADWRWLRERDDTPWYPTMRLFRQPARGNWTAVFQRIARALGTEVRDLQGSNLSRKDFTTT